LWQLDGLSCWIERDGLAADELTPGRLEQFAAARRAAGYATWVSVRSVRLPLEYLREAGVVPVWAAAVEGPLERLFEAYRGYLACERGLAPGTIAGREPVARLFFEWYEQAYGLPLGELSAAVVSGFLAAECPKRSVSGARALVAGLRPLWGYLYVAGLIGAPLVSALPKVADLRGRSLPRGLEPASVVRLLASCDRRRTVGRRDYAVLLLLARLGLRAGEVAAMGLDDVDWRRGEILVRGKGGRRDLLPLPVDVGEALVSYLRRRPRGGCRALFLCVRAPRGPISRQLVSGVVRNACVRAGLPSVGSHRLRHTAATGMLRAGASLAEIAQVLRHNQLETTALYAKVDRVALRPLARPWPGGGS
jgi:site-specific recombinase XerD